MNQVAMVHKRPPAAGDSPAATASERLRVANINRQIAEELGVREQQVEATVTLLDGGATVPFVARYRKEITGALDDAQLRTLEERLNYLRELEERRTAILNSVREQGKLDAALEAAILAADSKGRLEDIYLPFKPKRRTKAEIAREAGLEPLAELLLTQPENDPQVVAAPFVDAEKQVADVAAALDGARAILVERFAEDADLIGALREQMWSSGLMTSTVRKGKKTEGEKFKDYFDFSEPLHKAAVASHPGDVPRREGRDPRPADAARAGRRRRRPRSARYETEDHAALRHFRSGPPRRQMADGDRALGLAHQDPGASQHRSADAAVERGRAGSGARVRLESARPAAGGAGRRARHHGARSRLPLRRQGRGRRCHRQGGGDHGDLSA